MTPEDFGRALVVTGDLDPIYLMLNSGSQDPDTTARWCLAYWCYYHAGVASRIAENSGPKSFWHQMWAAFHEKWPRGTERRHFRGENAQKSLAFLQENFPQPEDAVASLAQYASWKRLLTSDMIHPVPFVFVSNCAQSWVGFGPWIAFKIADMLDCVIGVQVDFPQDSSVWFEEPVKGAVWAEALSTGLDLWAHTKESRDEFFDSLGTTRQRADADKAIQRLLRHFRGHNGPDGRPVRIQEVETIMCKWKSHINGRYEVGKDTQEILHGLIGWGPLADALRKSLIERTPKEHHNG